MIEVFYAKEEVRGDTSGPKTCHVWRLSGSRMPHLIEVQKPLLSQTIRIALDNKVLYTPSRLSQVDIDPFLCSEDLEPNLNVKLLETGNTIRLLINGNVCPENCQSIKESSFKSTQHFKEAFAEDLSFSYRPIDDHSLSRVKRRDTVRYSPAFYGLKSE